MITHFLSKRVNIPGYKILFWLICFLSGVVPGQDNDDLFSNFQDPPYSAQPRTWWHWTGGNVTLEGISKDLEWMKRSGIAGFQLADVRFGSGQSVDNKILFMTDEWLQAVRHAALEAERLDLEMAVFSSAGWSLTGGPWVKPEQAMKKLVWSDTLVSGGQTLKIHLPHPPSNNGPIQNLGSAPRAGQEPDPTFYRDVAVLAYPVAQSVMDMQALKPKITSSGGPLSDGALLDDDLNTSDTVTAAGNGQAAWLQYEFEVPYSARAITISGPRGIPVGRLQYSHDGKKFITLVNLPGAQLYRQGWVRTFAFPLTEARYFRIEMNYAPLGPAETMHQDTYETAPQYILSGFVLHPQPYIHRWQEKAGFRHLFEYESVATTDIPAVAVIQKKNMIDLTPKMSSDGYIEWDVPQGSWNILRLGYALTGAKNRPAMPSGLGFEVDKLSAEHTKAYIRNYMKSFAANLGPLYGKSLRYVLLDSWEAGTQNWTDNMLEAFKNRRGYDATPYLPALAGRIVGSAEISDRFLWDFRRTLADMFAENHYGVIAQFLSEQGIGTYGEASGVSLEIPEDALLSKKFMDIPMGEFWVRALHPQLMYYQDIRGAASAAHVYGKNIVAAESFTGGNYESPLTLKQIADYWFCQGVNRLVFHTSAHQPLDSKPGNTMVGTHLHRNITWAEQAGPFMDYMARTSFMLQQGRFVADIVYLLNEGAPSTMPIWGAGLQPAPPEGYDYDYINSDVLLNRMTVNDNGELVTPEGMSYRILVLPQIDLMTLPVLKKIKHLVQQGATILGPKARKSPGLQGYPSVDTEIKSLADEIWGDLDGISRLKLRSGKGQVIWGLPLADVLASMHIARDLDYSRALDMELYWIHRQTDDNDIYFIVNSSDQQQDIDIRCRVFAKSAQLWFPDSGSRKTLIAAVADSMTAVSITLEQYGSAFIVFDKNDTAVKKTTEVSSSLLLALEGPWQVDFPPNSGAPASITLNNLDSWTENSDTSVKYFSGTATYNKNINVPVEWLDSDTKLMLDLGRVYDLARISVNGQVVGICWKPPYISDITKNLQPGENRLQIEITNQWTNRMLGDRDPLVKEKVLAPGSETIRFFFGNPSLQESGLLGPVSIKQIKKVQ